MRQKQRETGRAQAMNINTNSQQSTQSQTKDEDTTPNTNQRSNMSPHYNSEMKEPVSVSSLQGTRTVIITNTTTY